MGRIELRGRKRHNQYTCDSDGTSIKISLHDFLGIKIAETVIDAEDREKVSLHSWCLDRTGYVVTRFAGKMWSLGSIILDHPPNGCLPIHHKDDDSLNYRKTNLRICTAQQHAATRPPFGGSSKYKGVHWYKDRKRWRTQIRVNGRGIHLGYFEVEEDAARAYNEAAAKHFGKLAYLNSVNVG